MSQGPGTPGHLVKSRRMDSEIAQKNMCSKESFFKIIFLQQNIFSKEYVFSKEHFFKRCQDSKPLGYQDVSIAPKKLETTQRRKIPVQLPPSKQPRREVLH